MPWITAALVAISALWVLFQDTPGLTDVALLFATVLVLVLMWSKTDHPLETFSNAALQVEDGLWETGLSGKGHLVTYVSAFRTDSYSTTSNVWQSVAEAIMGTNKGLGSDDAVYAASVAAAAAASISGVTCLPDGSSADKDFTFSTKQPVWNPGLGFALANTSLNGPMSMNLLPPSSQEYTAFCLIQLTGLPATPAALLYIPANGNAAQNGLTVTLATSAATTSGSSSITAQVEVFVGDGSPLPCSDHGVGAPFTVTFDTGARYLLCFTRQSTNIRVSLFNVESSSLQCRPNTILDQTIPDDALLYSNQQVVINPGQIIAGNIMSFGMFDVALVTQDEASICSHYHDLLLQQNPTMQSALAGAAAATLLQACPYDQATCDACASVTSWADMFKVMSGGAACLTAIDTFCTANPTHVGCECYNPATITTLSVSSRNACQAMQSAFSGSSSTLCAGPVQQALAAAQITSNAVAEALAASNAEEEERLAQLVEKSIATKPVIPEVKPQSFFAWLFGF